MLAARAFLAADACEGHGLQVTPLQEHTLDDLRAFLPAAAGLQNPVDMLATASADHYARAMRILLADPNVDSLMTIFIPPLVTAAADVAAAMTDAARTAAKPVLATFMSVEGAIPMLAPIPCYRFPEAAVAALGTCDVLWRVAPATRRTRRRISTPKSQRPRPVLAEALARGSGWLTPAAAQRVLAVDRGFRSCPRRPLPSPDGRVRGPQPWLPGGIQGRSARQSCTSPMSAP